MVTNKGHNYEKYTLKYVFLLNVSVSDINIIFVTFKTYKFNLTFHGNINWW